MSDGARTEGTGRAGESNLPMRWLATKLVLLFDFPVGPLIWNGKYRQVRIGR
jgi:hypothetical protein